MVKEEVGKIESKEKFLYPIIIVIVCLAYSSLYFFNTYPVSEGWNVFNAELLLQGKIPYKDFYYYLPPLNVFLDAILWKLSFKKLLIYRGWYLLQRILILLFLYRLITKKYHRLTAMVSVIVTSFVMTASAYDLFGDYNQTMLLLSIGMLYSASGFAKAGNAASKKRWLFVAGIFLGLTFLNKQPLFVATFLIYFIALVAFCHSKKDPAFLNYVISVGAGTVTIISVVIVYLASQNAFAPFLEQVFFNTDGKGNLFSIVVLGPINCIRNSIIPASFCYAMYLLFTKQRLAKRAKLCLRKLLQKLQSLPHLLKLIIVSFLVYAMLMLVITCGFGFLNKVLIPCGSLIKSIDHSGYMLLFLLIIMTCGIVMGIQNKRQVLIYTLLIAGTSVIAYSIYVAFFASFEEASQIKLLLFPNIQRKVVPLFGTMDFLFALYYLSRKEYTLFFYLVGGASIFFACAMGAGLSSCMPISIGIAMPVLLCTLIDSKHYCKTSKTMLTCILSISCSLFIIGCVAQKSTTPYQWWGYNSNVAREKLQTIESGKLQGVKVPEKEKEMYEDITHLISMNTTEDDEVWGYPYIKIFNILADRYTMRTFVPVLFPDVVSDTYVLQATQLLKENLPGIILWKDLGDYLKVHEDTFRGGEKLEQRNLEKLMSKIIPEKYQVLGCYNGIEVYLLKEHRRFPFYGNIDTIIKQSTDNSGKNTLSILNPLSFDLNAQMVFMWKDSKQDGVLSIQKGEEKITEIVVDNAKHQTYSCDLKLESGENEIQFFFNGYPAFEDVEIIDVVIDNK